MERLLQVEPDQFVQRIRQQVEQVMRQVMQVVNDAPDGNVIGGSEMAVRDLMAELRRVVYQTALQMRIDSTESSFSPSDGPADPQAGAQQGAWHPQQPDGRRTH